jgi:hypothetical protein
MTPSMASKSLSLKSSRKKERGIQPTGVPTGARADWHTGDVAKKDMMTIRRELSILLINGSADPRLIVVTNE